MPPELTLVGDGIENPSNARTMLHAAEMFGAACRFRNRKGLVEAECDPLPLVTREALASEYAPIVACDNFEHAGPIYGFGLPKGPRPAWWLATSDGASPTTCGRWPTRRSRSR